MLEKKLSVVSHRILIPIISFMIVGCSNSPIKYIRYYEGEINTFNPAEFHTTIRPRKNAKMSDGVWKGDYTDASGVNLEIILRIKSADAAFSGDFWLVSDLSKDPLEQGKIKGIIDYRTGEISGTAMDSLHPMRFQGMFLSDTTYGQSLYGTIIADYPAINFYGGVWVVRFSE